MKTTTISQLRKKPFTQSQASHPVLLTLKYDTKQIKLLIQLGIDSGIRICTRVDIVTPNDLRVSEDFTLSSEQIKQVWQNRPKAIQLYLKPPENLTEYLPEIIIADVGIEGLLIDKVSADYYLAITQGKSDSASPKAEKKRATALTPKLIMGFVTHLVLKSEYKTHKKFVEAMTSTYLQGRDQLEAKSKYNGYDKITNVYCIRKKPKEGEKSKKPKYLVNFSINNIDDVPARSDQYALSSFENIFHKVRKKISLEADKK